MIQCVKGIYSVIIIDMNNGKSMEFIMQPNFDIVSIPENKRALPFYPCFRMLNYPSQADSSNVVFDITEEDPELNAIFREQLGDKTVEIITENGKESNSISIKSSDKKIEIKFSNPSREVIYDESHPDGELYERLESLFFILEGIAETDQRKAIVEGFLTKFGYTNSNDYVHGTFKKKNTIKK